MSEANIGHSFLLSNVSFYGLLKTYPNICLGKIFLKQKSQKRDVLHLMLENICRSHIQASNRALLIEKMYFTVQILLRCNNFKHNHLETV